MPAFLSIDAMKSENAKKSSCVFPGKFLGSHPTAWRFAWRVETLLLAALLLFFAGEFAVQRRQTDAQQQRRFFLIALAMLQRPIHMRLFLLAHEGL